MLMVGFCQNDSGHFDALLKYVWTETVKLVIWYCLRYPVTVMQTLVGKLICDKGSSEV